MSESPMHATFRDAVAASAHGIKLDLLVAHTDFEQSVLRRRVRVSLEEVELWVASPFASAHRNAAERRVILYATLTALVAGLLVLLLR
jgi:hypothetical protein